MRDYREKMCPVCKRPFKIALNKFSRKYPPSRQVFCSHNCMAKGRYRNGCRCNEINPLDAAYIAGFLDGEGSIMLISRGRNSPTSSIALRVVLAQSEKSKFILDWVTEVTGIGNRVIKKAQKEAHDDGWTWVCHADAAEGFLRQLLPFLRIKKEQAQLGIAFHSKLCNPEHKSDIRWQKEARKTMKNLNKRGKHETTYQLTVTSGG